MEFSAIFWIHWIFACLKTVCIISSCINTLLINIDRFTGYRTNVSYLIRNGKIYFTEFTQISIRINMGMIFFEVMEAVRGQKHLILRGQKYHEGVDLLKKVYNKSFSATSKNPQRVHSHSRHDLRQETRSHLQGHAMYIAPRPDSYCYVR